MPDDGDRLPLVQAHAIENLSGWLITSECEMTAPSSAANTSRMRGITPTPASTQSCLARWCRRHADWARCRRSVVASRVARSSSNAFSIMAVIRRLFQSKFRSQMMGFRSRK